MAGPIDSSELVQQHLATWLARRREDDADDVSIPRHIEGELRD